MSSRPLRLAVVTAAALCAIGAALVVAFATGSGSSSGARPLSKFAAGDPDATAATKFGNGNELIGREDYAASIRAYPADEISPVWTQAARSTFARIASAGPSGPVTPAAPGATNVWQVHGPKVHALEPGVLAFGGAPDNTASRTSSFVIHPSCNADEDDDDNGDDGKGRCRVWAGPVGGGIWRTENALAGDPTWKFLSLPFAQNSIGAITLSPSDPNTLYVGTGEPNSCSSGCAAGVGLYKSTNGGDSWVELADACVSNATNSCVTEGQDSFLGRGISGIIVDPSNPSHLYVGSATAARSLSHVIGLGGQVRFNEPGANTPGLYESFDGGATFTPTWIPNPVTSVPGPGRRGVIDLGLDPNDPATLYASAFDKGVWRRCPSGANTSCDGETSSDPTDFKQVFAPRFPGTDVERTMFALTVTPSGPQQGHTRIYLTTGQTGNPPAPGESSSSFWRTDNANHTSSALLATEPAAPASPPAGDGNPYPASYDGWQILTTPNLASPYWATHGFCTQQCWYDQDVYTPAGRPDHVYVQGSYLYGELPCYTRGVGCGNERSNGRAVLWSTTAGDPDASKNNRTFTDLTYAAKDEGGTWCALGAVGLPCTYSFHAQHPDQHEILVFPRNKDRFLAASDGGLNRSSGKFVDASNLCSARAITGDSLTQCQRLLSRIPARIKTINKHLSNTLQFVGAAVNPSAPCHIIAGTQDNGTWSSNESCNSNQRDWNQIIYGDGGNTGFDTYPEQTATPTGKPWMFNEFTSGYTDANFRGGDPERWVVISGPLIDNNTGVGVEAVAFYWPQIADPNPPLFEGARTHPIFTGLQHVWRSWAWGAGRPPVTVPQATVPDIAYYEANCPEFITFGADDNCGDFQPLGGPVGANQSGGLTGTVYGSDRQGGAISWIARRAADTNTLWATTSAGRVFVTHNADAVDPAAVAWKRVDNSTEGGSPTRHPNGIYPDPNDPAVAYVVYSGYNAITPTTEGHVFRVTEGATDGTGVFENLNVESAPPGPTPTNTGDLPVNDIVMDDATGSLYAATDFGVLKGTPSGGGSYSWSTTTGMPALEVSHLAIVPGQRDACRVANCPRLLYAATHARGVWQMKLN